MLPVAISAMAMLPSLRNCASIGAFRPWIMAAVFQPARSSTCTEPVNHELSSSCLALRPTANGYSMSEACMRWMSRTAPVFRSTSRKAKTSATHSVSPSIFMPAGTASLPAVSVRSSPVDGSKDCTALSAMLDT